MVMEMETDGRKLTLRFADLREPHSGIARDTIRQTDAHALDAIPEAVLVTRATRQIRAANRLACDLLRRSPNDLIGRSLDDLIIQQMRPVAESGQRATPASADGRFEEWSFLLELGDGNRQVFDVREGRVSAAGDTWLAYTLRPAVTLETVATAAESSVTAGDDSATVARNAPRPPRGRLRMLLDQAPLGYQVLDTAGHFLDVNRTWLDMFGVTRENVIGGRFTDMMTSEPAERFRQFYDELKQGDRLGATELEIVAAAGRTLTVIVEGRVERDAVGGVRCTHFTLRDVTENRRIETELRRSRESYKHLADSIADVFLALDDHLVIRYWNRATQEVTGRAASDVVGRHLTEVLPAVAGTEIEEMCRNALATQRPQSGAVAYASRDGKRQYDVMFYPAGAWLTVIAKDVTEARQAERRLQESEERFRLLFQTAPEAVCVSRLEDGVCVDANDGFTTLTGYTHQEVVGKSTLHLGMWSAPEVRTKFVAALLERGHVYGVEAAFRMKNGSVRTGRMSARIVSIGGVPHIMSITRDVTAEHAARQALLDSEQRFRQLFDSLHSCVLVVSTAEDGGEYLIRDVNRAGEIMTQTASSDVVGCAVQTAFPCFARADLTRWVQEVDCSGQPVSVPLFPYGDDLPQQWGEGYACRLPSRAIVVIIDDVSARVRAAEALRKNEQMYRRLVETMTEGLAASNDRHELTYVNQSFCAMVGHSQAELLGMNMAELLDSHDLAVVRDHLASAAAGQARPYELRFRRKDGHVVTAMVSPANIMDPADAAAGVFAVYTDITERKQSEERLRQAGMQLDRERQLLQEKNAALKEVLAHLEQEKVEFRESLVAELAGAVSPALAKLRRKTTGALRPDVQEVENGLKAILAAHVDPFRTRYAHLSAREAQVCDMIVSGLSSKEISEALHLSPLTVHKHRESIRKKLGLQGRDVNLSTFLRTH